MITEEYFNYELLDIRPIKLYKVFAPFSRLAIRTYAFVRRCEGLRLY